LVFYEFLFNEEPFNNKMMRGRVENSLIRFPVEENSVCTNPGWDLLHQMVENNPVRRINAIEALEHDYFKRQESMYTNKSLVLQSLLLSSREPQIFESV
jgi:serine/threonine protein kinase